MCNADECYAQALPQPCQGTIGLLVCVTKALSRWLFLRRDAVGMKLGNALVSFVSQIQQDVTKPHFTVLEQAQVMCSSFTCGNREKLSMLQVNHQLCFERMPFVLATIEGSLFFLGRSIGTSVTSMTTTSQLDSACCSCRLPGSRN